MTGTTIKAPLAVCAAVIEKEGKVLLTQRPHGKQQGGFWEFPGGKIDPGESPHQSLKRELSEELAIEIEIDSLLETVYYHYDWGSVLIIAYLCRWTAGELAHIEVADHAWATPEQFSGYHILPADQPILDRLRSRYSEKSTKMNRKREKEMSQSTS
ncbi:8-oxo-dGTP diphosphatase [Malonomonas rubra DSM 5091]|uniref:8-oxo-dGTP diphosphatase n=1 Tax=Malonomonas rubra DSM 5091 TaxID=1122189 RepID=A0A1M6MXB8_MALRU|nr:(deoxy)nucleoside triphosphate pyrophosphohydrolase [Malonomonas rubra]SHJ88072.1 8-oxo-dGTP diphosphatase [Malonomonas rubra DSM 5091]